MKILLKYKLKIVVIYYFFNIYIYLYFYEFLFIIYFSLYIYLIYLNFMLYVYELFFFLKKIYQYEVLQSYLFFYTRGLEDNNSSNTLWLFFKGEILWWLKYSPNGHKFLEILEDYYQLNNKYNYNLINWEEIIKDLDIKKFISIFSHETLWVYFFNKSLELKQNRQFYEEYLFYQNYFFLKNFNNILNNEEEDISNMQILYLKYFIISYYFDSPEILLLKIKLFSDLKLDYILWTINWDNLQDLFVYNKVLLNVNKNNFLLNMLMLKSGWWWFDWWSWNEEKPSYPVELEPYIDPKTGEAWYDKYYTTSDGQIVWVFKDLNVEDYYNEEGFDKMEGKSPCRSVTYNHYVAWEWYQAYPGGPRCYDVFHLKKDFLPQFCKRHIFTCVPLIFNAGEGGDKIGQNKYIYQICTLFYDECLNDDGTLKTDFTFVKNKKLRRWG